MLGHHLEREGVATTQISLIREHTAQIAPPRALWVPFELGRPLGPPGNPAFQTSVLLAALALLERAHGPVLADFPDDEPESAAPDVPLACPVGFADAEGELLSAFRAEVAGLRSWYDEAVLQRRRTTADTTGLVPEQVAEFIAAFARGEEPANPLSTVSLGTTLKMASEDLKAYYNESVTAQPGRTTDPISLEDWFWGETAAARVLNEVRKQCLGRDGREYGMLGNLVLVPRRQLHRFD